MRALLILTMIVASAAGCHKFKPAPIVIPKVPSDNPSILVNPPYPGEDKTGSEPSFTKMSALGNRRGNNDRIAGTYGSSWDCSVQRRDGAMIDPEEIAAELRRWIQSAPRVQVTRTSEDPSVPGKIRRTIDYETAGTVGYVIFSIEPATPAKRIQYKLDIREQRR